VDGVDTMLSEKLHQSPHASWVDRPPKAENFRRKASASKEIPEPANSVRGPDRNDRVPALA
jgi:hypothetical protein